MIQIGRLRHKPGMTCCRLPAGLAMQELAPPQPPNPHVKGVMGLG